MLTRVYDPYRHRSFSALARSKRLLLFTALIAPLAKSVRVLDVGGSTNFWQHTEIADSCSITLLNLGVPSVRDDRFSYVAGDGCNMEDVDDNAYDVVFSNSVIEHVGTWQNQQRMASELQRVSKHHFVQTPNYYFPIEPHFLWPGLQWLPMSVRLQFVRSFGSLRRSSGQALRKRMPSNVAVDRCRQIRLLTPDEMGSLFPRSRIVHERIVGLSKSLMAIG